VAQDEDGAGKRSSGSRTLARGLALLTALGEHSDGATVSGLADATGLDRAVLYRLLDTLTSEGFVTRASETRKYR
jgi:DNA-binding IclR family transcriptional regulator